jgi:DNA-binding HxlR family transcriptional regulator
LTSTRKADVARQESERIVITNLTLKSPQRWSDLLERSKMSSRTLRKTLKRLEEKGLVYRQMKQGDKYPPPVLYGLSSEGKKGIDPILFSTNIWQYILGTEVEWNVKGQGEFSMSLKLEKQNIQERIEAIGRKLGSFYLFSIFKYFQDRNIDWITEAKKLFTCDPLTIHALELADLNIEQGSKYQSKIEKIGDQYLFQPFPSDVEYKFTTDDKRIKEFRKILEQIYPLEIQHFEDVLAQNKRDNESH